MNRSRRPLLAAAVLALAIAAIPAAPAASAPRAGWVRLAHMSPDTAAVNITLSSISGDVTLFRLQNVGYGAVSKYMRLPQGTYALAMVPAGKNDPDATPVVSGSVEITAGKAETLAAIGANAKLKTTVFTDDLDEVAGGDARVRVVQASVAHPTVDVTTGSTTIAKDAAFGDVSKYAKVDSGESSVELTASGTGATKVQQDLAAGSSHTLFVIDDAGGDLTVSPALDSAAATETPVGSLAAGGGGLADDSSRLALLLAAAAALGGAGVLGAMGRRRGRADAVRP